MEPGLTHRQIEELLGAYALDAVDPDEAAAVEAHLAECPRCREEVAAHRETAAYLASVGAPAPDNVWDRIAEALGGREGGAGAGAGEGGAGAGEGGAGAGAGEGEGGPGGEARAEGAGAGERAPVSDEDAARAAARITDLARRRAGEPTAGGTAPARGGSRPVPGPASEGRVRRAWSPSPRLTAAALAVAAVFIAVLGVQLARLDQRLDDVREADIAQSVDEAALFALSHPDARRVELTSDDGVQSAEAVLLPDGQGFLFPRLLRPLTEAETYQLWAVIGDQKISVGVLGATPKVTAFHYDDEPSVLAITAERAGGVVASEKQAVAVGFVEPKSA